MDVAGHARAQDDRVTQQARTPTTMTPILRPGGQRDRIRQPDPLLDGLPSPSSVETRRPLAPFAAIGEVAYATAAMLSIRAPRGALRLFVQRLWLSDDSTELDLSRPERVRMLPIGTMHVAVRLSGPPIRLYDGARGRDVGHAVVGGARAGFYVRDVARPARSLGAQLAPGAALPLFGVPASALAGAHTELDALWGDAAHVLRDQLIDAVASERQLALFEGALAARLPRVRGIHPAVAHALMRFDSSAEQARIADVVDETGYSHRRFITLFCDAVGLTPKRYCRVRRFQRAIDRLAAAPDESTWGAFALEAGYSDQAHFTREFTELAGVSPGRYRALAPAQPNHVPIR